jgi:non-ribosomal peptide synthetase component F
MFLLAAYQLLLHRCSGQEDIVVGTPIANRNRPEIEGLIGYFANTLALRTDMGGDPTVRELLQRVRSTALEAYAHQDIPFESVLEELQPPRDPSRQPLFQAVLALHNLPRSETTLADLRIAPFDVDTGTSKFDLTLIAQQNGDGLELMLEYNTDLFLPSTANRLLAHLRNVMHGMSENPGQRISEVPLLGREEKEQLLTQCQRKSSYPVNVNLLELFENQTKHRPQARAVGTGDEWFTYSELNHRANQLAHYLLRQGIGRESLVGILVERTPEMVIAILGCISTFGSCIPARTSVIHAG